MKYAMPVVSQSGRRTRPWVLRPDAGGAGAGRFEVQVIYTSQRATLAALKAAADLASQLGATIHLVVAQVVPYPRPLEDSPVTPGFAERRFLTMAGGQGVETIVHIHLCRDRVQALEGILRHECPAVIAGSGFWLSKERRLARKLAGAGIKVVYIKV